MRESFIPVLDNQAFLNRFGEANAFFSTIDFTANGGDGYPFAALGVVFENNVVSVTYQEALADFIESQRG